jgi:transposase
MRVSRPATRKYDASFREDCLALLRRGDRPTKVLARDLGLPASTLQTWYETSMGKGNRAKKTKSSALPVGDPASESPQDKAARLEKENAALRRENDALKLDRAILKKAAAFFAKESE